MPESHLSPSRLSRWLPVIFGGLQSIGASAIMLPRVIHLGNLGDGLMCLLLRVCVCVYMHACEHDSVGSGVSQREYLLRRGARLPAVSICFLVPAMLY